MILITGGMGFIGLHTARRLIELGERVVLTQFRTRRSPSFIAADFGKSAVVEQLDVGDERQLADVVQRNGVTSIIHLAVPGLGALDPRSEYRMNTEALSNILRQAERVGGRATIASSVSVYSGCVEGPFHEDLPLSVESQSSTEAYKKAEEILGLHLAAQLNVDSRFLRIAQIYGPLYHSMRNLPSRVAHAVVRGTAVDLTEAETSGSGAHRSADLCYVSDCADGIALAHLSSSLRHRIYNLGSGRGVTASEVVAAAAKIEPAAETPVPAGSDSTTKSRHYMDIERLKAETGYEPRFTIELGMESYIDWLKNNDL